MSIAEPERFELVGRREDHVEVCAWQQLGSARVEPAIDSGPRALRARAMMARVVVDVADMALRASTHVSTQCGGPTLLNGTRRHVQVPREVTRPCVAREAAPKDLLHREGQARTPGPAALTMLPRTHVRGGAPRVARFVQQVLTSTTAGPVTDHKPPRARGEPRRFAGLRVAATRRGRSFTRDYPPRVAGVAQAQLRRGCGGAQGGFRGARGRSRGAFGMLPLPRVPTVPRSDAWASLPGFTMFLRPETAIGRARGGDLLATPTMSRSRDRVRRRTELRTAGPSSLLRSRLRPLPQSRPERRLRRLPACSIGSASRSACGTAARAPRRRTRTGCGASSGSTACGIRPGWVRRRSRRSSRISRWSAR